MPIFRLKIIAVITCLCLSLTLFSCTSKNTDSGTVKSGGKASSATKATVKKFTSNWDGKTITKEYAQKKGWIFCNSSDKSKAAWKKFTNKYKKKKAASVTVCGKDYVRHTSYESYDGSKSIVITDERKNSKGILVKSIYISSPALIYPVYNNEKLCYYSGSHMLYYVNTSKSDSRKSLPLKTKTYYCPTECNVSFPFQKAVSTISDFNSFYKKYGKELDASKLKKSMTAYDKSGGFNNHVIYLYGDATGMDITGYKVNFAAEYDGRLNVYVTRSCSGKHAGKVEKNILSVTINSQYLDKTSPDNIKWHITNEIDYQ